MNLKKSLFIGIFGLTGLTMCGRHVSLIDLANDFRTPQTLFDFCIFDIKLGRAVCFINIHIVKSFYELYIDFKYFFLFSYPHNRFYVSLSLVCSGMITQLFHSSI